MRKWLSHAVSLANQHYTAEGDLSCTAPKTWRFVLLDSQELDYGVGTLLLRIEAEKEIEEAETEQAGAEAVEALFGLQAEDARIEVDRAVHGNFENGRDRGKRFGRRVHEQVRHRVHVAAEEVVHAGVHV